MLNSDRGYKKMQAKDEENTRYVAAIPSIRKEETNEINLVATPFIREGAVLAAKNEETAVVVPRVIQRPDADVSTGIYSPRFFATKKALRIDWWSF